MGAYLLIIAQRVGGCNFGRFVAIIWHEKNAGKCSALAWAWNEEYSPIMVRGFPMRRNSRGYDFGISVQN